jgi:hypothetical protein
MNPEHLMANAVPGNVKTPKLVPHPAPTVALQPSPSTFVMKASSLRELRDTMASPEIRSLLASVARWF